MQSNFSTRLRKPAAIAVIVGLVVLGTGSAGAQKGQAVPASADARTITHVLNRLGFGARPGDVERVAAMGLAAYIDQQLHPERIDNGALETRLANFQTLDMSTSELATKFYLPALEVRREQQRQDRAAPPPQPQTSMTDPTMATPPAPERPAREVTPEQRMVQQAQASVTNELMQAKVLRAVMSERQLEEVLVDFWFNHFNVFVGKGQVRQYLTEYERNAIRPYVLGNFRDMLGATAHSPAMLFYLDNFQSVAPPGAETLNVQNDARQRPGQQRPGAIDPTRPGQLRPGQTRPGQLRPGQTRPGQLRPGQPRPGQVRPGQVRPGQMQPNQPPRPPQRPARGLNENYARELMELHTLGVDAGYTQQDVIEVARILTGWTIDRPQAGGDFIFRPQTHDAGEKTALGTKFPAGRGEDEGERLLDLLAAHPATAKHIAFKLAQRFVADEPPAALVDRAAKLFLDTKGDLREVTRAIVTSPEFFAADAYGAKVKTPFEFVVSAARAANANIVNAQPMVQALRDLGMPLYGAQPPTGYSMTADAWINTGALLGRMNFALQLVSGGAPPPNANRGNNRPGQPDQPARPNQQARTLGLRPAQLARAPIRVDINALAPDTSEASRDRLIDQMLAGEATDATKATLARAETPQQLIALALGSPEFQKR